MERSDRVSLAGLNPLILKRSDMCGEGCLTVNEILRLRHMHVLLYYDGIQASEVDTEM